MPMKRRPSLELLDSDAGTPEEIAASLRDLRWFNRWFGGVTTGTNLLQTVARRLHRSQLSLLEVASGEGFVQQIAAGKLSASGVALSVTLLDRAPTHLPRNGSMSKLVADALQLPFGDFSFDLVSCSLFTHHLSPDAVVRFVHEALRVCRIAVLVNDLVRHRLHLAWAYAGLPLYRSRITRNDALASVRQAYTELEMVEFCREAGASAIDVQCHFLFRMGVIAWKQGR
jgi:ubiquinone/menaquinone biosynthesis C-methylase UbiE